MYFNYYLEFVDSPLKTSALKTLILYAKKNQRPRSPALGATYERILYNVFRLLHQTEDE